jgi:hypothetical protein
VNPVELTRLNALLEEGLELRVLRGGRDEGVAGRGESQRGKNIKEGFVFAT